MTLEEAIKILEETLYDEKTPKDYIEAVKMGKESLINHKDIIQELKKIKVEIYREWEKQSEIIGNGMLLASEIIEEKISELKGEQK